MKNTLFPSVAKFLLILGFLIPSVVFADNAPFVRKDAMATPFPAKNGEQSHAAVDSFGSLQVNVAATSSTPIPGGPITPGTGATNLGKAEDAPHVSGDVGVLGLAVRNDSAGTTFTNTNGDNSPISVSAQGAIQPDIDSRFQSSSSLGLMKIEDVASASGDAGVFAFGVRNDTLSTLTNANGDYSGISVTPGGAVIATITATGQPDIFNGLLHAEDQAATSGDAGVETLYITEDPLTVAQNASGDYANPKTDRSGRTIVTNAPAGESWQACSTAAAGTTDVAIKAAVASNRIYLETLTCFNNSAVASLYNLDDGASSIWQFSLGTTTLGNNQYTVTFPVPLRGTVNTALNIKPTTNATSTICCGAGYVATN